MTDVYEAALQECQEFFTRLGLLQAETLWFTFCLGQLGVAGWYTPDQARLMIGCMRNDIDDQRQAAEALWEKMEEMLDNAESKIGEPNETV